MNLPKRYSIGELAKLIGVSTTTLKAWSQKGYIPKAHRDNTLNRARWWTEEEAQIVAEYKSENYNYY